MISSRPVWLAITSVYATNACVPSVDCVTGATGFLASELIAQLLERGHRVRATVRSLSTPEKVSYLHAMPGANERLSLHEADLLDDDGISFDACIHGANVVYHTASTFLSSGITNPQLQLIIPALNGTRNVFASISRSITASGVTPRVVLTSSIAAVMGTFDDKPGCFDEVRPLKRVTEVRPAAPPLDALRSHLRKTGTCRRGPTAKGSTRTDIRRWRPSERRGVLLRRWELSYQLSTRRLLWDRRAPRESTVRVSAT